MSKKLKVLILAAEAAPFAKVGGLADIAAALPKSLRSLDVDARLLIPRYGTIRSEDYDFHRVGHPIPVPIGPNESRVHLLETTIEKDVPTYLIWHEKYFSSCKEIYGFNNDPQRFTFFSRAVIEVLKTLDWKPDVIHAHDWHTAPVVAWLDFYGRHEPFYRDIATLYTIHNLAYQGLAGRLLLPFARMKELPHLPVEPPGKVSWMAQGIAHADLVNTVSPTYAREILEPKAGMGLESLLSEREGQLFGVLNGIDTELWNPDTDSALPQTFSAETFSMRSVNKAALQREIGLQARENVPLLGMVSRLDRFKGFDILFPALQQLLASEELQVVILGAGEAEYEARLRDLQAQFPSQVRVLIKFDERLARRIYGGIDIFLMPSLFESCGLSQMIAMHYGAVPVVRATGGLVDTVVDGDAQPRRGNGFAFAPFEAAALAATVQRALVAYAQSERWQVLQQRGMEMDFSWEASARTYIDLYRRALAVHG
ncbi:MAG: glycogen synthase [Chloroflexota bacterium]|nr:glycogen synthase [Chloroflexota bacterium]